MDVFIYHICLYLSGRVLQSFLALVEEVCALWRDLRQRKGRAKKRRV